MMRICKTCGCELEAHGLPVCPSCLLEDASIQEGGKQGPAAPSPRSRTVSAGWLQARLPVRSDFFDRYSIQTRVGLGGQGEVWEVWDFQFRRTLAMKRLPEGSASGAYRFIAEAQIASQLKHPGVLPIYDLGLDPDGRAFYTTDLLAGATFSDVWLGVKRGYKQWTLDKALEMLVRVTEVMAHAHARGVIHRDLKPSNVMVGAFGDVRVIDWGSARVLDGLRRGTEGPMEEPFVHIASERIQTDREDCLRVDAPTGVGGLPMTISFMPPEIVAGRLDQLGPETDVFSMGVMLYELLAHRLPFADQDGKLPPREVLLELVRTQAPVPVRTLNRKISRDLAAITEKAMAFEKSDRYRSMDELAADIRAAREMRPVKARQPTAALRLQKLAQRNAPSVVLGCFAIAILAVSISAVRTLMIRNEATKQVRALRDAELAARNGRWRDDLKYLQEAEAAHFEDEVLLGIQRVDAWTALNEPDRAGAELRELVHRADLGPRRGAVLLKMGDYELFDKATIDQGIQDVREALAAGLGQADELVARGLLAESAPESLDCFQRALKTDPYSYSAHVHSLGLEFVLGRHAELKNHVRLFSILFPDDPSPRLVQAMEAALAGREADAVAAMEPLRQSLSSNGWSKIALACRDVSESAGCFSLEALANGSLDSRKLGVLMTEAGSLLAGGFAAGDSDAPRLREPHLPCLEHGVLDAVTAVQAMAVPLYRDISPFVRQIKASWQICPEAVLPFRAAIELESRQPKEGPKSISLLRTQADLFQLAAESPSVIGGLPASARYAATAAELELMQRQPADSNTLRGICLSNIQVVLRSNQASAAECMLYFESARQLSDALSANRLLDQWLVLEPGDPTLLRKRVEVKASEGDYEEEIGLLDKIIAKAPNDLWAREERARAVSLLTEFVERAQGAAVK